MDELMLQRQRDLNDLDFDTDLVIVDKDGTPMKDFYEGKHIFLTGVTGFFGQLYLQKLMSVGVAKLYCLMRPRKNKSCRQRLEKILEDTLFNKLYKTRPNFLDDIVIIEGDIEYPNIGISDDDWNLLIINVEIVIHSAADVRFDAPILDKIPCTVIALRCLLEKSLQMPNLLLFCYISTAYSHHYLNEIKEEYYSPNITPDVFEKLLKITENNPSERNIMDYLSDKIIEPSLNTYVYSKILTEHVMKEYSTRLPTVVQRPSIVISTYEDPIPGWIQNFYGLTGILITLVIGFNRIIPTTNECKGDFVCADHVINSSLAIIWNTVDREQKGTLVLKKASPEFYNITADNFITCYDLGEKLRKLYKKYSMRQSMWYLTGNIVSNPIELKYCLLVYHVIPGLFLDLILRLLGKDISLVKIYRRIHYFLRTVSVFTYKTFKFRHQKTFDVYDSMTKLDKQIFPCDLRQFDWDYFTYVYYVGGRMHLLKEPLHTSNWMLIRDKIFIVAHFLLLTVYYSVIAYIWYRLLTWIGVFDYANRKYLSTRNLITGSFSLLSP